MLTVESIGTQGGDRQTKILEDLPQSDPAWRQDPYLSESFHLLETRLIVAQATGKMPKLVIPERYVPDALELAQNWGEQDKETEAIGVDDHGYIIWAHHLYRGGRSELLATVVPHAFRLDEMVCVDCLTHASEIFEILFDARNRRLTESKRRTAKWERRRIGAALESIVPVFGQNGKVTEVVGSGVRTLCTFNVLPSRQLAEFHFNDQTGMAEIIARKANFNPETGMLEVTDRSGQVDAKLQDIFSSRINELVAA